MPYCAPPVPGAVLQAVDEMTVTLHLRSVRQGDRTHVAGHVEVDGDRTAFAGWMELLGVLEAAMEQPAGRSPSR